MVLKPTANPYGFHHTPILCIEDADRAVLDDVLLYVFIGRLSISKPQKIHSILLCNEIALER